MNIIPAFISAIDILIVEISQETTKPAFSIPDTRNGIL